jgi:PPK2 family polyphosphate:nucleotide phosphotransferase
MAATIPQGKRSTIDSNAFRIPSGKKVRLADWPTVIAPFFQSDAQYQGILRSHVATLRERQSVLEACDRYALLLIFQGMDGAGKDGSIQHVMSGVNPAGCDVASFKTPSAEELHHDFLWRTTHRLPQRGRIGIFNRSYYEEVLIVRVHPSILEGQHLPAAVRNRTHFWRGRYRSILDFEQHLHRNGTVIIKIFLHLSKQEQRKRLLARIDVPDKNWKFNVSDVHERQYWTGYMRAYADCLTATSTPHAPWYAVPADHKENAWLIVSQIVMDALDDLKMTYPKTSAKRRQELRAIGMQLGRSDGGAQQRGLR